MFYYSLCKSSCSGLIGTLMGIDLKIIGVAFMSVLMVLSLLPDSISFSRIKKQGYVVHQIDFQWPVNLLRTAMLAAAIGGEILLLRFQWIHNTYCPYCLAFGACVLILFVINLPAMNRWLAVSSLLAGIAAFSVLFKGSLLPVFS